MADSIYQKLSDIQSELFVPKGQRNEFGGFNYRSCEDILKVLKPLLAKNKCTLYMSNEIIPSDERSLLKATVTLVDLEGGGQVSVSAQAREPFQKKGMDDMQITGAASSYARKYALAGMFAIDNERDADTADNRGYSPSVPANKKQSKPRQAWNLYSARSTNTDDDGKKEAFKKLVLELSGKIYGKDSISDSEWDKIIEFIKQA